MLMNLGVHNRREVFLKPDDAVNSHVLFLGTSGSGKTVAAQKFMIEIAKQGGTVLALSIHSALAQDQIFERYRNDFDKYARHMYANKEGIPCKLFQKFQYLDGSIETDVDVVNAVTNAICTAYKLGYNDRIVLEAAIEQVVQTDSYKSDGFCSIGKEIQKNQYKESDKLFDRLKPVFSRKLFSEGDLIEKGRINIIHLDYMDLLTQRMAAELVLAFLWRAANADQFKENDIWLFLDEAQNYCGSKEGSLSMMLSEGRKMKLNLLLATQFVATGSKNAMEQRMMQCGSKLLFKPSSDLQQQTAKLVDSIDYKKWLPVLSELRSGEFIACGYKQIGKTVVDYPLKVSARDDFE